MRILFLTPFLPSEIAGGHNYTRLLLKNLAECGHKIDLLYCKYPEDSYYANPNPSNIKVLKVCKISSVIKFINAIKFPFFHPVFTIRFSWKILFLLKKLDKKEHYDLIYLDHPQMYLYGLFFSQKKILMAHDVMAQRYERGASKAIAQIVKLGEKIFFGMRNCSIFSFSNKDQYLIKKIYGIESYVTDFFIDEKIQQLSSPVLDDYFVFFGKWDRNDNLDGLKWFFTNVYEKMDANTHIYIIGVALPKEFQTVLTKYKNVRYLGFVDNPYTLIANAKAMFAPLFSGAGVKVKVVESLACGTPVIGNDISFEGISEEFRNFMISASSPKEYLVAISNLNRSLTERVSFRSRFLKRYNSQSILGFLKKVS